MWCRLAASMLIQYSTDRSIAVIQDHDVIICRMLRRAVLSVLVPASPGHLWLMKSRIDGVNPAEVVRRSAMLTGQAVFKPTDFARHAHGKYHELQGSQSNAGKQSLPGRREPRPDLALLLTDESGSRTTIGGKPYCWPAFYNNLHDIPRNTTKRFHFSGVFRKPTRVMLCLWVGGEHGFVMAARVGFSVRGRPACFGCLWLCRLR